MTMVDCTFMGDHQRELKALADDIRGRVEELYDKALFGAGGDTTAAQTALPILFPASIKLMSLIQVLEFHRVRDAHS